MNCIKINQNLEEDNKSMVNTEKLAEVIKKLIILNPTIELVLKNNQKISKKKKKLLKI